LLPITLGVLIVISGVPSSLEAPAARVQAASPGAKPTLPVYDPTSRYVTRTVEGWQVLVHPDLLGVDADTGKQALRELETELYLIRRHVPAEAVAKLQHVRIWLERNEPHHPCAAYHPGRGWLVEHGMNPDKTRCLEIANAATFLKWTHEQPWMVLHELSHAYHDQFLSQGFANPEVRRCYQNAVQSGTYEAVPYINSKEKKRAYALTNAQEYFAEASEALFGLNDFYPFNRRELETHDPDLYKVMRELWGMDRPPTK
jgi:hypothetical protein